MLIRIRHDTEGTRQLTVTKTIAVTELREKIRDLFGIPPNRQRLIYAGKCFVDGEKLHHYNVGEGHVIYLTEKITSAAATSASSSSASSAAAAAGNPDNPEPEANSRSLPSQEEDPAAGGDTAAASSETTSDGREPVRICLRSSSSETTSSATESGYQAQEAAGVAKAGDQTQEAAASQEVDEFCLTCHNNPRKKCKSCGCTVCGGKHDEDKLIACDECDSYIHTACHNPPLEAVPEGDFYCALCRNDSTEIIQPGQRVGLTKKTSKMPSRIAEETNKKSHDWGSGNQCVGRRKVCTIVPPHHFGPIPGIEVGMTWETRMQLSEEGIHRPPVAGIAGTPALGARSLVLSGGYPDDEDLGIEFYYTGAGGRDLSGNKRSGAPIKDQEFKGVNEALAKCCAAPLNGKNGATAKEWKKGKPIRVCRAYKLKHSKFAPKLGYRYDGIYKVVKYWPQRSKFHEFLVYRYLLRRDDPALPPWDKKAQQFELIKKSEDMTTGKRGPEEDGDGDGDAANPSKKAKAPVFKIDAKTKALIGRDKANSMQWKQCLDFKAKDNRDFVGKVEEVLACVCCYFLPDKPITTSCGHILCDKCYKRCLKEGFTNCPICLEDMNNNLEVNAECAKALQVICGRSEN